jgi:hypothetical protein
MWLEASALLHFAISGSSEKQPEEEGKHDATGAAGRCSENRRYIAEFSLIEIDSSDSRQKVAKGFFRTYCMQGMGIRSIKECSWSLPWCKVALSKLRCIPHQIGFAHSKISISSLIEDDVQISCTSFLKRVALAHTRFKNCLWKERAAAIAKGDLFKRSKLSNLILK